MASDPVESELDFSGQDSSKQWRVELLTRFGWALFLGWAPLVAYAVATANLSSIQVVALCQLLACGAIVALGRRLDFRARGTLIVLSLLFAGSMLAGRTGPTPGTLLSLALGTVLASVLFGVRAGLLALAASAACFWLFGTAARQEMTPRWVEQLPRHDTWVRMTATYSLVTGLLVLLVSSAVRRVEESLKQTRASLAEAVRERRARTAAEDALRENEERLRLALEAAQMGTWERCLDTGAVTWTRQMEALVGFSPGTFPGTFEAFQQAVHPDDRPVVEEAINRALSSPTSELHVEYRVQGPQVRWIEGKGRVYRDASGRPVLLRGTAEDITERKRAEEALRRSEAELRALFASMEDVILVFDAEGRYVRIAPTNPALFRRPPAELLGRHIHEVFPAEADFFLGQIRRCLETRQTLHFEYSLNIRGSLTWFAAMVSPMLSDSVVWVARDVTEKRRAEIALRESEERWRRISEATSEGIGFSDEGVMFDVNERLAEMLGFSREELIGMPVLSCVAPEDREKVAEAGRTGHTGAYEHRALRKDGSTIPVEVCTRFLTLQGRPVRVAAIRDLSERTRLEAELRRRETLAAMGSLVAAVAHEVRTPLFSLSATLDTLEAGVGTPDEQQELRDLLRSQVRRLSTLMQDLLDYGRPPKLRLASGAIRTPIEHAMQSCQAQATLSGVRIEIDVPDGLPEVSLDPQRLEQVFENLVTNALQYSQRGATVMIRVRSVEGPPTGLACHVLDQGPGLPQADLQRLFEPFFSRRKGGTGMGLAIAQRLVEAHGGSLSAGNRAEGGAEFIVVLPARQRADAGGAVA